ncbi:hypothetical protein STEG23_035064 [Scotinomys teguina]
MSSIKVNSQAFIGDYAILVIRETEEVAGLKERRSELALFGTSGNVCECGEYSYSGPLSSCVDLHITTRKYC